MEIRPAPRLAGICPRCQRLVQPGVDAYQVGEDWQHATCAAGRKSRPERQAPKQRKPRKPWEPRPVGRRSGIRVPAQPIVVGRRGDGRTLIHAAREGRCSLCEWPVFKDDLIVEHPDYGWVHDRCLPETGLV